MKQVPIFFVFSLILLLAGCTVTQPLPTSLPTATLPTTSPTTQPPTSTANPPVQHPPPTRPNHPHSHTHADHHTNRHCYTPCPLPQPTAGPTHAPDIIDPSLPPPIGRIYFLWEPIPIPEEHGIHEIHDNNFYILASETMPNDWHTDPALEMVGHPTMRLSPDSTKLAILRPE
ncbi:MAG: hypothetical protein M5U34_16285 [Chloroflexi bacterium]|nr:hypothetical protein [Chloroflexota bacterium]